MTTALYPSNHLSFYRVPLLVRAATTPVFPQIPTPPLIFQEASPPTSGASFAPPPALLPGPHLHPHSNCGLSPSTPHCLRGSPEDPVYSLLSSGHLSPAHTQGSVIKSWWGRNWKSLQDPENIQTQTRSPGHFPQSWWERERVSKRKS